MEYIYSLYDPQTSKLLYRGTPEQLVKAGLYKRKGAVSAAYRVRWIPLHATTSTRKSRSRR